MSTIEAAIFDCDGIIVDSAALQVRAEQETAPEFAEAHNLHFDREAVDWNDMDGWARRKIAANIFGVNPESEQADAFRIAVVEKTVEIICEENAPLITGFEAFAEFLRMRGVMLGVATSSNRAIYTQYCAVNTSALDFCPSQYVVAQGECHEDKPKPGPYREVMKRMNVDPERTLIVEDSSSGITAGRYAGGLVLALPTTKPEEYLLAKTGAHIVAPDFRAAAHQLQGLLPL